MESMRKDSSYKASGQKISMVFTIITYLEDYLVLNAIFQVYAVQARSFSRMNPGLKMLRSVGILSS